jgi:transglutaminase/protease-like cytokinesis protein 3
MTTKGSNVSYEFSIGKGENSNYFAEGFNSKEDVEKAIEQVEQARDKILKGATGNNYEKMKYVHNWMVDNISYGDSKNENSANIYGALVKKSVVCEGYARAYKYLMDELNIPCVIVYGNATNSTGETESHAWNYVQLENGKWYAIDVTWDDPIIYGGGSLTNDSKYKYFLVGADSLEGNHEEDYDVSGTGQNFKYPELSKENY